MSSGEKVQSSANGDGILNAVARVIDAEKMYQQKIDELYELKYKMMSQIEDVDNSDYRTLLMLRYVQCLTFEQIAVTMHYTYQWVNVLHNRALKQFEEIYLNEVAKSVDIN